MKVMESIEKASVSTKVVGAVLIGVLLYLPIYAYESHQQTLLNQQRRDTAVQEWQEELQKQAEAHREKQEIIDNLNLMNTMDQDQARMDAEEALDKVNRLQRELEDRKVLR